MGHGLVAPTIVPPDRVCPTGEAETSPELRRLLGFWSVTALVIGPTIGSGIFRVPAAAAAEAGSPGAIALVWVLGGVISLCGALTLAELAAALDQLEPLLRIPYYLSPGWLRIDPTFAPLRGNPRFERLVNGTVTEVRPQ